jgi:hypothetical protein
LTLCVFALAGLSASFAPADADRAVIPFDPHELISDGAFRDAWAASAGDLRTFLARSPHGRRSALASWRAPDGRDAVDVLVAEAERVRVNPVVLLAKIQVEQSLVARERAPGRAVDRAMGCHCPEGRSCAAAMRGFEAQVRCATSMLVGYADEIAHRGATRSLWRVGSPRPAACGVVVAPRNRATASLYTYTPYVLEGRGGNWLFHRIFRRYAHYLGYYPEVIP